MSRRMCLGLKTRPMVEVRPLSLISTPVTHSTVLNAKVRAGSKVRPIVNVALHVDLEVYGETPLVTLSLLIKWGLSR